VEDDDYLPLSGLQHLVFCERQCALIHVERIWEENRLTTEGALLHAAAHAPGLEARPGVRLARGVLLRSEKLRVVGRADVVEFHQRACARDDWIAFPVEYKRGRRTSRLADRVQLCAQAMALEEMLGAPVVAGALYYGASRRRQVVDLTDDLRATTVAAARRFHEMVRAREVPRAVEQPKCRSCSLRSVCMPAVTGRPPDISTYLRSAFA
jgi:CRISPR-associated exonuclease Cas4